MAFFIGNSFCRLCQMNEEDLKNELIFCNNGLRTKGLLTPLKSIHSTRLPNSNRIWTLTPLRHDLIKDMKTNCDVNYFDLDYPELNNINESINEQSSIHELKLHSELYKLRPDVNAICHTNNPFTISSFKNGTLENVHGEAKLILGDIPVIRLTEDPFNYHKSEKFWEEMIKLVSRSCIGEPLRPIRTIILLQYGVISLGACLHEARAFVEILEEWARFNVYAKIISRGDQIRTLTLEQLRSLGGRYARSIKFSGRRSL